jgi:hypothetical protein
LVLASFAALLPVPSDRSTIALPVAHSESCEVTPVAVAMIGTPLVPDAPVHRTPVENRTSL